MTKIQVTFPFYTHIIAKEKSPDKAYTKQHQRTVQVFQSPKTMMCALSLLTNFLLVLKNKQRNKTKQYVFIYH